MLLKYFYNKILLHKAAEANKLQTEQTGGRPQQSASDTAIKTVLYYESARMTQTPSGKVYNDVKACYDCIIINCANMCTRQHGLPLQVAKLYGKTLAKIKYTITTNVGKAPNAAGHLNPAPWHGFCQGSGNAGTLWGLISNVIIHAYNKECNVAILISPLTRIIQKITAKAFVDDVNLSASSHSYNTVAIPITLQQNIIVWDKLLFVTGGKLKI